MRKIIHTIILLVLLGFLMPAFSIAGPLDTWTWRNPLPQGNHLNAVTYGSGLFVAVGDNGTILTSADNGVTWITRTSGTTSKIYSVMFNGTDKFVATVDGNKVATSPDGINWSVSSTGMNCQYDSIAFGEGIYVAVTIGSQSCGQYIYTSNNGVDWNWKSVQTGGDLYGIAYGNIDGGKFIAVGENAAKSYDGADNWATDNGYSSNSKGVAFGNDTFVVVGGTSSAVALEMGSLLLWVNRD